MGASESMFDGVSGLNNHQQWMNVIGNNIANINTAGFKEQQFNFSDLIYQTLKGASGAVQGGLGGTNLEQVGLGTQTGSIATNEQQGALQTTNLATDFAIQGDGFFIVNDGVGQHYTRDGNFIVDGFGNINSASNGAHLQGYGLKQIGNSVVIDTTKVVNLTVPQTINPAQQTNVLDLLGNLQSSSTTPITQSIGAYDSLGQLHNVILSFTASGKADGNWTVAATSPDLTPGSTISISGGNATSSIPGAAGLHFNALGQLDGTVTPMVLSFISGNTRTVTNPPSGGPPAAGASTTQGPTQAAQPWVIPGTVVASNAGQSALTLNLNDPAVGNLTQFASPTSTSTQAAPNTVTIANPANPKIAITGNVNSVAPVSGKNMGQSTFVAQDSTGATHTFQVGLISSITGATPNSTFTPTLLTVDGFSGVATGTLGNSQVAPGLTGVTVAGVDSTGQTHNYHLELSPNTASNVANEGTTWSAFVDSVDGSGFVPLTGSLQIGSAAFTPSATQLAFNKVEPDGVNHQFVVTMSVLSVSATTTSYVPTAVTVDGVAIANVTVSATTITVTNATNVVVGALSVNVGAGVAVFGNAAAEQGLTYDFSRVVGTAGSSSLQSSVGNPTAAIRYSAGGSGILQSGGALSLSMNQNSLFVGAATVAETNSAQVMTWDFAQLANVAAATSVTNGTGISSSSLPATLAGAGAGLVFAGGAASSNTTATLNLAAGAFGDGNTTEPLTLDFSQMTNLSAATGLIGPLAGSAGNTAGTLKNFNVDQAGILHGVYSNGFTQTIGQILLATFENPSGLSRSGQNGYDISANSGVVSVGIAGSGKIGTIAEGNVETSNVDLATEFSNMILAERGFQANSRIITTSDQMLQDVVALKQ